MNLNFRRFLDPTPAGPSPSLSDLDNPAPTPTPPVLPIPPGGAEPTPPVEGVNPDGTLQEGYIKDEATGTVVKDPNFKPKGEEGDDDDAPEGDDNTDDNPVDGKSFWESVDKLRGNPLPVEFPEDVDPLSPEAVLIREKAVADEAMNQFVHHLQQTDPRGYAYLLHRQSGGSDEEFFSKKTFSLPDYGTFKENIDVQQRFYLSSLISKGLKPEQAQVLVDQAIKDNKLFELADEDYKVADLEHQNTLREIQEKQQKAEEVYTRSVESYNKSLTETIEKGMKFIVPDTDKTEFANFVRNSTEYNNQTGKFMLVHEVDKESLGSQLEALYLLYKKGDLSKLIERKAKVLQSARLGGKMDKSKSGDNHKGSNPKQDPANISVPLGQL